MVVLIIKHKTILLQNIMLHNLILNFLYSENNSFNKLYIYYEKPIVTNRFLKTSLLGCVEDVGFLFTLKNILQNFKHTVLLCIKINKNIRHYIIIIEFVRLLKHQRYRGCTQNCF